MTSNFAWGRAAALVTLLLAGCMTVGPDYKRPAQAAANLPAANAAFVGADPALFAAQGLPAQWWRLYRDPVLDDLIAQALHANIDLRVAAANIAKSRAASNFAESAGRPTISSLASPQYARPSAEEQLIPGGPLDNNFVYGVGAGVSYQVDLFGQIARTVEAANADLFTAQAAYDATRVTVVSEVTRAYLESCSAGREMVVATSSVELQAKSSALTQRMTAAGRGTSLDTVRSSALEDQVKASLPTLRARKQLALYRLAVLTGQSPEQASAAAAECAGEPTISGLIPIGDGAALLKRRPDVRRAESELRAATARIGVATADLYPKVTLGASIGSVGLTRDFLDDSTVKFSLGPLITWQFPDRKRTGARIRGAEAERDAAYARFDGAVLNALRETESALVVYARDLDTRAFLSTSVQKSAKAASDTQELFAVGRVSYLPVLDANRSLIGAEQALAAQDSRLSTDQVALFLALGGGWEDDRGDDATTQ